ncbi:MAG: prepilin-type N-terminal cleavage/methylation domain-containing protein, partial [Oscillospiraceae bacterium]|nr:prepilin-type N-terminal cleavage/methylation domain-containing protein [Oscillospiraceae bacterium]
MYVLKRKGPWFGKNSGLTLNELIVVLVIVSVLAAVAIPAMIGTIRHGQQNNRTNIARTLYVAMQGQLTRAVAEGNLRTVLTDGFYERDSEGNLIRASGEVYYTLIDDDPANLYFGQVYARLGANFPDDDDENSDYVFFISKPAGFVRNSGSAADDTPVDKFFDLLDEVIIDKSILDDAILMEFNIRTGVVLSIFYG